MLEYLVIFLVGLIGMAGGALWVVLLGALGLSLGPWFDQWKMLKGRPLVPLDTNVARLVAATYGNALAACGASYLAGYFLGRVFLG
jgi:hypothetical protein